MSQETAAGGHPGEAGPGGEAAHPAEHIAAGEVVPLLALGERLLAEARAARSGRAGRTVITLPGLRTTLLALTAGNELAGHQAPGAATIACLTGQATLSTADRRWRLREHDTVAIPAERHRVRAESDILVLLTVRLD